MFRFIMDKPDQIPEWENSKIFGINKEPAHSTLISFESLEKSKKNRKDSQYYISFNGIWKFNWVDNPSDRPVNFYDLNY